MDTSLIPEIKKFSKESFDLDSVINAAEELKYIGELKRVLASQFREPDDEWVKSLISRVFDRPVTQKVRDQFTPLVAKATKQFLSDQVNERLKTALGDQTYSPNDAESDRKAEAESNESLGESIDDSGVVTTEEELEGFQVIRAIAVSEVTPERIEYRDAKTYFAILLDDNNRKPIARLRFNTAQKYIGLFDAEKNETRHPIDGPVDIYKFADQIRATVHYYD